MSISSPHLMCPNWSNKGDERGVIVEKVLR